MNHLLENYATIGSTLDTLCSAMAEKGYPNYVPTADTLWNVYSLVSAVNNGSVPYDLIPNSADFCKGNTFQYEYGVKAEKVKHRKSRKAKRLEGTYHQGKYSFRCYRRYYLEKYHRYEQQEKIKFKQNHLLILDEAYSDYMETYFGDTDEDYYGFDWFFPIRVEPNENNIIVGDNWEKYAHCD